MLGVAFGTFSDITLATAVWVCVLAFTITLVWRKNSEAVFAPFLLSSSLFILCLGLGLFRVEVASQHFGQSTLETQIGNEVTLTGTVVREPEDRTVTKQLTVKVGEDLLIVSTDRHSKISYGDVIEFSGILERPEAFETEYGRTFNYEGYLKAKGIEYLVSFADVQVVDSDKGNPLIARLLNIKQFLKEGIEKSVSEPAASLGEGLLLGEKRGLGEELEENFRRTGIIHIVVLSGYNVMLVVSFVIFILSFVLPKSMRLWFGLVSIVCFALIVGLSATVVRASIMAALLLIAQSLKRTYDVIRALFIAGLVMVAINPYLLVYDVGFQLSFMATLGLILALPFIEPRDGKSSLLNLRGYIGATIATQIAVLPLLLFHIGQVSLVSVLVNVLVLPLVPLAMFFTFITGIISNFSEPIALIFSLIATFSLEYIILMASWWGNLPFASVVVPAISPLLAVLLYVLLALTYWYLKNRNRDETNIELLSEWTIVEEQEEDIEVPKMFRKL